MYHRSPSLHLEPKDDAPEDSTEPSNLRTIVSRNKIHRIRCRNKFFAEVTNVVSPSEIWIRPLNHIADKLVFSTKEAPLLKRNLRPNVYVMTPVDDETLVRARILFFDNKIDKALVRLIDHGDVAWRDSTALFEMRSAKDEIRRHPWQAIPVMLQGVNPISGELWSIEEVNALKDVLSEFPYVFVLPTLHEKFFINDDSQHMRVSLHGAVDEDLDKYGSYDFGVSISHLYFLNISQFFTELETDAFKQQFYHYPYEFKGVEIEKYAFFDITPNPAYDVTDMVNESNDNISCETSAPFEDDEHVIS